MALSLLVRTAQGTRGSSRGIPLNATPRFTPFRPKERSPLSMFITTPTVSPSQMYSPWLRRGPYSSPMNPLQLWVARSTSEMRIGLWSGRSCNGGPCLRGGCSQEPRLPGRSLSGPHKSSGLWPPHEEGLLRGRGCSRWRHGLCVGLGLENDSDSGYPRELGFVEVTEVHEEVEPFIVDDIFNAVVCFLMIR